MAEGYKIWQQCPGCDGTGVNPKFVGDEYGSGEVIDDTCNVCNGDKNLFFGWMSKEEYDTMPDDLPGI